MAFNNLVTNATKYFPDLKIKYKNTSTFMKILGKILFFNPEFMTDYITTIGSTVYFPSEDFVSQQPFSASIVLLHELTHVYDSKRLTKPLFMISYLFPQILSLVFLPLIFLCWKIFLPLFLLSLLPLPSYGRMYFERRGYFVSLYAMNTMGIKYNYNSKLISGQDYFSSEFTSGEYYWMWVFSSIKTQFINTVNNIIAGNKPFDEPELFTILESLINNYNQS